MKNWLRISLIVLFITALFFCFTSTAFAEHIDSGTYSNLDWVLDDDGTLTISGTGDIAGFTINDSRAWRKYKRKIRNVILNYGVTEIGSNAFNGCTLKSITIPSSVTKIHSDAFAGSDLTNITIPSSVTYFESGVFSDCPNLLTAGPIGSSSNIEFGWTTEIPSFSFYNCKSLTSITIPSGVKSIGLGAFYECNSLTSVTIPSGVESIGEHAFYGCSSLNKVTIPSSVTSFIHSSWDTTGVFSYCTNLLTAGPIGSGSNIEFGWTTEIPSYSFYGCRSLTSITIPSGVKSIGFAAFGYTSMTSVTFPSGVESIGGGAFSNNSMLVSIMIPLSVKNINNDAFICCPNLTNVYYAGTQAQWSQIILGPRGAIDLTHVDIHYMVIPDLILPADLTTIKEEAFLGGAFTFVKLSEITVSIGRKAFAYCQNLTYIYIPETTIEIDFNSFDGISELTVFGKAGSIANEYANDHGFVFVPVS